MWLIVALLVAVIAILLGLYFAFRKAPKVSISLAAAITAAAATYFVARLYFASALEAEFAKIAVEYITYDECKDFAWKIKNNSSRTVFWHSAQFVGYFHVNSTTPATSGWVNLNQSHDWLVEPGKSYVFCPIEETKPRPIGKTADLSKLIWQVEATHYCLNRKDWEDFFGLHSGCNYQGINYAAGG